jgi:MarR family transcriptional regulator, organic hydroperoxide resistance regulator
MKTDCIFFQFAKAHQLGNRFLGQKVSALGITPVQAMILGFLGDEDKLTSIDLGKRTELDSATLTGLLDRLESAQIIERRGNPDDRRSILIHLTEKGRTIAAEAIKLVEEANHEFLADLTKTEKDNLHAIIRKLRLQPSR